MSITHTHKWIMGLAAATAVALAAPLFLFAASSSQGFEVDTTDWNDFGGTTTRVASGTDGITSSEGSFHAVIDGSVFTRWGGYENTFPAYGYTTSLDVYLDMALADGSDKRFDFSSAINDPAGNHRRDFIFHLGTNPGTPGEWAASASNNAPGWPLNPDRNPVAITESGWYTMKHTFADNGGVLEVTMQLLDSSDNVVGTWVLSDPSDVIGVTVGGNRYGWFTSQRFDFDSLAIDNAQKTDVPPPFVATAEITSPLPGSTKSGVVNFTALYNDEDGNDGVQWAVRAGTCAAGTGTVYGNVDGKNTPFTWDGASFSASIDMTNDAPGVYCFIFNPTEDQGDPNLRITSEFTLEAVAPTVPTEKDQCKQGGWEDFGFENQGQCVSFVNHHDDHGEDDHHVDKHDDDHESTHEDHDEDDEDHEDDNHGRGRGGRH